RAALKDKPDAPFRVPANIKLIPVDPRSGMRSSGQGSFLEAFKPGTAPPDSYSIIGLSGASGRRGINVSPDAERNVGAGTGGLY
ncbi:MAG: penicillin-binding protein, partial [Bosea sp. (in: a-proteobacteria)]